jgi:plastocyanin
MKKLITLLLIVLMNVAVLSTAVSAHGGRFGIGSDDLVGKDLPKGIRNLFADQRVNVFITLDSNFVENYSIVTQNGVVTNFAENKLENPTLIVSSTESNVRNILTSDNQIQELQAALRDDKITYKAVGFRNKMRFSFVSLFARISGWFGGDSDSATGGVVISAPDRTTIVEEKTSEKVEVIAEELQTHIVKMTNSGFKPENIEINKGETVVWEVDRTTSGMVIGVRNCRDVKSKILSDGDTFEWTFDESGICTVVDGIMTTEASKVTVN